jgi:FixJ family two-component response regulator
MGNTITHIAIVEDDARVRVALERLLQSAGYAVLSFDSGDQFFDRGAAQNLDCLVLDLHMPGMSGFDVQRQLRSEGRVVPVVVITGQDSALARERAFAGGASAYLCKPIDREELTRAIEAAIRCAPRPLVARRQERTLND